MNRYEQIPSEIKCIYERLDPLLPAMPFTDASSALFVLMIFHATWFLTKKRISLLEKSRWLTSMRLTDLPVWPSLRRLPGREGNGQGRQLEPYLAGCFPCPRSSTDSPTADLTGLETKGWIWRQYLSLWNPMLHRDVAGGPVAKSPHPRFRGPGLIPGQRTRSHKPQIRSLRSSTEK